MVEFALLASCLQHITDHDLIRAIAKQESAGKPTALYINRWDQDQFSDLTLDEAVVVAETVIDAGYTVDVGLMGVNSRNIEHFGFSIRDAFDPCTNVTLGEKIYFENTLRAERAGRTGNDIARAALSLYNTGSFDRGFVNGYVDKVWSHYTELVSFTAHESSIDIPWENEAVRTEVTRVQPTWLEDHSDE